MYKIRFNEFEKYYNVIESLIANGLTKIGGDLAFALYNASVILDVPENQEKYEAYKEKLESIIVDTTRKYIEELGINVLEIFEDMKKTVQISNLSLERYCYYYDLLKTSYKAQLEDLNYLEIAKILQRAQVEGIKNIDDIRVYNYNQYSLLQFIALTEKDKKR